MSQGNLRRGGGGDAAYQCGDDLPLWRAKGQFKGSAHLPLADLKLAGPSFLSPASFLLCIYVYIFI